VQLAQERGDLSDGEHDRKLARFASPDRAGDVAERALQDVLVQEQQRLSA
jgi:hypothetical protein